MTSVTKSTGSSGTMRITDDGTHVTFELKAGSGTYNHDLPWGSTVNGSTNNSRTFDYVGDGGYQTLGTFTVSTNQTVTFRLFDSGTSGIGGPTTLTMTIDRATVPPAPTPVTFSSLTNTSVHANSDSNGTGGADVDIWQIGYGTSSSSPQHLVTASDIGEATITGLTPGTTYYFWSRRHNSEGWGAYSSRTSVTTLNVPSAPTSPPTVDQVTQVAARVSFIDPANGGSAITSRQIGYGTDPAGPSTTVDATTGTTITGLLPSTTYYFWTRATNTYGAGPWSASTMVKTLAGSRIKVDGVWVFAVPYVKDSGVWKVAKPYVRQLGAWKETS